MMLKQKISILLPTNNFSFKKAGLYILVIAISLILFLSIKELYTKSYVKEVMQRLASPNAVTRTYAAIELGEKGIKDSSVVQKLIEMVANDNEELTWLSSTPQAPSGVPFDYTSPAKEAAEALGKIQDQRALMALIRALKTGDYLVRIGAARALRAFESSEAVESLIEALNDNHQQLRSEAAISLGKLGKPQALEPLIIALDDEGIYYNIVQNAIGSIARKTNDSRALELLLAALKKPRMKKDLRGDVLSWGNALKSLNTSKALKSSLISFMKDKDIFIRAVAAYSLSEFGTEEVVNLLIAALQDESPIVRKAAADAFASMGWNREPCSRTVFNLISWKQTLCSRVGEQLIVLLNDNDINVKKSAIVALGGIKYKRAVEPLIVFLKDDDFTLRISAISALGDFRDERALEPLMLLINEKEWENPRLRAIDDDRNRMKDEIIHTLRKITGRSLGYSYDVVIWQDWYQKYKVKR